MYHSITALLLMLTLSADDDAALERYRITEQAKEQTLRQLEEVYHETELARTEWRRLQLGRTTPIAATIATRVSAHEGEFDDAQTEELRPGRRRRMLEDHLRVIVPETLIAAVELPEALARPFGTRIARFWVRADPDQRIEWLETALDDLLGDGAFHLVWNGWIFRDVPEASQYRDAYNEYVAAGVEVERLRNPERYLPGGGKIRPGMVYIPGGSYQIGPNTGFERRGKRIAVRPFLIDQYEVSNGDYQRFLVTLSGAERTRFTPTTWPEAPNGEVVFPEDRRFHPVAGISWTAANAYAGWAGKRLPTEEEWEVAARGRAGWLWPWGDESKAGRVNDAAAKRGDTVEVHRYRDGASEFGVLQAAGNVAEWTASLDDGRVIEELPSSIAPMVIRGGHYLSPRESTQAVFRWMAPGGSTREPYLGFRCAANLR